MKNILLIAILVMTFPLTALAKIAKEERILVVVSELNSTSIPELKPFHEKLENLTQAMLPINLRDHYKEIFILSNNEATYQSFKQAVRQFTRLKEIRAIDVILALNAGPEELTFKDQTFRLEDMQKDFLSASSYDERDLVSKMKKKLRILYNLSSFGFSHNPYFYQMGFDVTAGAASINTNAEDEFLMVLGKWKKGYTFKTSFIRSNNPVTIYRSDEPVRRSGQQAGNQLQYVNSKKFFYGFIKTNISTEPREVY